MSKPILSWFGIAALISGNVLITSAAEPSPQAQNTTATTVRVDAPKLP